jgi:hypothetical protein
LNYMKEFDTKQTYKYLGESDEDCKMMQGCRVEVYLEGKITGESVTILFINGRLAPFAKLRKQNKAAYSFRDRLFLNINVIVIKQRLRLWLCISRIR